MITRFAPSPNGHLHFGHLVHLIWTWGVADFYDAQIVIRMEDHDQSRSRQEFETSILEDLVWLDFSAEPPGQTILRQSSRFERYREVARFLEGSGLVYACRCSRREIADAGRQTGELHYPGRCRYQGIDLGEPDTTWRLHMPDRTYSIVDFLHGPLSQNPQQQCGDIVIRDRNGNWTYQFCVVIDDLDQNIDLIIRGEDLLNSVGRQLALREYLASHLPAPRFLHHPLIIDSSGRKLSKRFGSQSIKDLRLNGWSATQLLSEAACAAGLAASTAAVTSADCRRLIEPVLSQLQGVNP